MSTTQPATARAPGSGAHAGPVRRHLGLALFVIATAQLMVVLDATIVNVALPHITTPGRHTAGLIVIISPVTGIRATYQQDDAPTAPRRVSIPTPAKSGLLQLSLAIP